MPLNAERNRWLCPGEGEVFHRSFAVAGGWWEFSAPIVQILRLTMFDRP